MSAAVLPLATIIRPRSLAYLGILCFPLILAIPSCLSPQTRAELDAASARVASLTLLVEQATATHSADEAALRAQLASAQELLAKVQEKAINERVTTGATVTGQIVDNVKPLIEYVFPPGLLILNLIGGLAATVKNRYGTPATSTTLASK